MILVEYGGNDCDFNWEEVAAAPEAEHLPKTPLSKFEGMMRGAVKAIKDKGITPLADVAAAHRRGALYRLDHKDGPVKAEYRQVARRRAHDLPLPGTLFQHHRQDRARDGSFFVDVRSYFLDKHNYKHLFCADGIHPNVDGHELIRVAFGEFMRRNDGLLACGG